MTKSADAVSLANQASDLDARVSAFEADRLCGGLVEIEAHLPDRADPNYVKVLCELIRVDMEYSWRDDSPRGIDDYLRDFPELIDHDESLESLTFEETRLRRQFAKTEVRQASVRSNDDEDDDASPGRADTEADSEDENRVARMLDKLPRVGQEFAGFGLVAQLGVGAFSKVYLAKQRELSDRFVALKVSAEIFRESRMLAQLQHANIMPVYSVHQVDSVQAVCMPYLGSTTLADAIESLFRNSKTPRTGEELVSLIQHRMRLARAKHNAKPLEPSEEYAEQVAYEELRRLTYVDAILAIALKLTAGLAHAHDRFILHRDIKPANVLLTDLGEPMLLDFNLSADVKNNAKALVKAMGGTLPYMSPEQLEAFRGGDAVADARSDQFSLGIVLYEVLTGKAPYPEPKTGGALLRLEIMVRDRRRGAPSLCEKNPLVSSSVDAIVRKMLDPDPGKRYDTTHALREDLIAQLENRPLLHAREPSLKERAKKWARRHPRLASARTVVSCVALLAIAITGSVLYVQHRESRREAARVALAWTQDQLEETQWLLHVHGSDRTKLRAASVACAAVLER